MPEQKAVVMYGKGVNDIRRAKPKFAVVLHYPCHERSSGYISVRALGTEYSAAAVHSIADIVVYIIREKLRELYAHEFGYNNANIFRWEDPVFLNHNESGGRVINFWFYPPFISATSTELMAHLAKELRETQAVLQPPLVLEI